MICYNVTMKLLKKNNLSNREIEVLMLMLKGMKKITISEKIGISIHTVKSYVEKIYKKFNKHNRVELLVYLIKNNIIEIEPDD